MNSPREITYANERWYQLLVAACKAKGSSVTAVAAKLGYGRPRISQVLNGIAIAKPDEVAKAVIKLYDRWECPYLNTEITGEDCHTVHSGPTPSHDPARLSHRRVCRGCTHRHTMRGDAKCN